MVSMEGAEIPSQETRDRQMVMHAELDPFPAGTVLSGKYRVERVLGRGGMGMVVSARHLDLGQRVALKFILAEVARHPTLVDRFMHEARAASKLRSEHVARVIDVAKLDSGLPYMVMEFLEGRDLKALLVEGGALPVPLAVDYVLQAIDAVAEAHRFGIVHRDLKPANLFLATRDEGDRIIKLLDFGISKTQGTLDESGDRVGLTSTSSFLGSPAYVSPEQCRSPRDVDARTDIWSLGAILYELLTGSRPFQADSEGEMIAAVLLREPIPFGASVTQPQGNHARASHVPAGLEAAVLRCLRKAREERFVNVAALAVAIAPFGTGQWNRCVERAVRLLGLPTPEAPPALAISNSGTAGPKKRSPVALIAIALASVIAISFIATIALLFSRHRTASLQATPPLSPSESGISSEPPSAPSAPARPAAGDTSALPPLVNKPPEPPPSATAKEAPASAPKPASRPHSRDPKSDTPKGKRDVLELRQ